MDYKLQEGDKVFVNFHSAGWSLCSGTLRHIPNATGDSWVIEEDTGVVHYVSEPCTVTRTDKKAG